MKLTKEYIEAQEDVIRRNFKYVQNTIQAAHKLMLQAYSACFNTILDVGSGGFMPVFLKADHACDVSPLSLSLLRSQGWKGAFAVCSCDDLPYSYKEFELVVCSEVIEHLPSFATVIKTFCEIDRVAKNWIVTTPCNPLGSKNPEKDHKRAFTERDLQDLTKDFNVKIFKDKIHFYIVKENEDTFARIFNRYNK